jgi:hypothetical protein
MTSPENIGQQFNAIIAAGFTSQERAASCAWCGDSMEGTEPHEALNTSKPAGSETLVGMHDECYVEASREDPSRCRECGEPLNAEDQFDGTHMDCYR